MSRLNGMFRSFVALTIFTIIFISPTYADEIGKLTETDDLVIEGQKEFLQRCAVCHGEEARGDGPYSFALVFKPADLTKLAVDNGGQFPFVETYLVLDGRDMIKYHGTRLMPIWGDRYSQETWSMVSPEYASTLVRGRIFELLMYLYTIQDPVL